MDPNIIVKSYAPRYLNGARVEVLLRNKAFKPKTSKDGKPLPKEKASQKLDIFIDCASQPMSFCFEEGKPNCPTPA